MKRVCEFYIRHAGWVGAAFCAVPTVAWYVGTFLTVPFRGVYVLRLVLSVVFGCAIAAWLNRYGARMWLCRHRSVEGPAGTVDGALIGAAVAIGSALVPTLLIFLGTNHPELAKTFTIINCLSVALAGGIIGAVLGRVGARHLDREAKSS